MTLRRLLTALLLLAVLAGIDAYTGIDVPGIDVERPVTQYDLPTAEDLPRPEGISLPRDVSLPEGIPLPDDISLPEALPLPEDLPSIEVDPKASSAKGEVEGPHVRVASWNLYNFGRTKDEKEISVAADVLRDFDLVAVQEVVTSPPGAQAIGRLDAALDRTGFAWDYRISNPTTGDGTERYAFLWKPSRVRLIGRAWLASSLADPLAREPYLARFEHRKTGQRLLVANFHAVPRSKQPAREVALLDQLHRAYEADHIVFVGDFNLDEDDPAFDGLRRHGYASVLDDQPTSLRRKRRPGPNGHLANEYDNIFYETEPLHAVRGGAVDFTTQFPTLDRARSLSDHVPVYVDVQWTETPSPALP